MHSSVSRKVVLFCSLWAALGHGAEAPPKQLMQYIQEAKKLGLDEEAIRRHARSGGWDPKIVDEALAAINRGPASAVEARRTPGLPEGYRLGAGDVIQVSVWKEPDASVEGIVVRADGKVSLPLVKEVEIAGMNPLDAEKMLTERFGKFIPGADVTLIVREVHSRKVYLVGAVRTVGAVDMVSHLTVLQAITQAGGVTDYAKKKQIYVLRNEGGKQVRFPFNYEAVIKGEQIEQNILLQPDDTIVVP